MLHQSLSSHALGQAQCERGFLDVARFRRSAFAVCGSARTFPLYSRILVLSRNFVAFELRFNKLAESTAYSHRLYLPIFASANLYASQIENNKNYSANFWQRGCRISADGRCRADFL